MATRPASDFQGFTAYLPFSVVPEGRPEEGKAGIMSERSEAYRRKRLREAIEEGVRDDQGTKERKARLEELPGYQVLLADPEWHQLDAEYRGILARYETELEWVGHRFFEDLSPEERTRVCISNAARERELGSWRQRAAVLWRDYALNLNQPQDQAAEYGEEAGNREDEEVYSYRVTLQQAAAVVSRSKRTLERWQKLDGEFPQPESQGIGGTSSLWRWSIMRPYLEKRTGLALPEYYPSDPLRPGFGNVDS